MGQVLSLPVFGGGVVLEGSSDAQRTDELQACDGYNIGPRGQLIPASDLTAFDNIKTALAGSALTALYGLEAIGGQFPALIGIGDWSGSGNTYIAPYAFDGSVNGLASLGTAFAGGYTPTFASFPYVDPAGKQRRVVLVCFGARPAWSPKQTNVKGLYALIFDPATGTFVIGASGSGFLDAYDALGTGFYGEYFIAKALGGTHAQKLYPRGVVGYNNHAFCWGFDSHDGTNGDGPNRLMFSNIGNPLKWGNDPLAAQVTNDPTLETDRAFVDSDAFTVGTAGEAIRGAYVWNGRLWVGTNKELHWVEGFGRDSFLTNGATPIHRSRNVVGPHAMIEGPDGNLYGVADQGLWVLDGDAIDPIGDKLRGFDTKSLGWWDLIWTDTSRTLLSYPGQSNADLVWMLSDPDTKQIWIGIPYCSASAGFGFGADSVVIKYHTETGGFTRQVFTGEILTHGVVMNREQTTNRQRYIATPGLAQNVQRYAYKATPSTSPVLPTTLPDVTFGEYAPFGPNGVGVMRRRYLTLAWETAASTLGLVFSLTPTADGEQLAAVKLSIQAAAPGAPADGDFWLDTSGTDTNLGNGTAGTIVKAHAADYLFKRWKASWSKWVQVPGAGQQGRRVTLPIAFDYARGTRFTLRCQLLAADRRYQLEGFGEKPGIIREAA